jgi:hypothetical protein
MSLFRIQSVVVSCVAACCLSARGQEKPATSVTVSYKIDDLHYKAGGKTGLNSVDNVVKVVIDATRHVAWNGKDGRHTIHEVDGTHLRIHAPPGVHAEVKMVLEALQRLNDVNVHVELLVLDVPRAVWEKDILPKLGKADGAAPRFIETELAETLRKASEGVRTRRIVIGNGREGLLYADRRVVPYVAKPRENPNAESLSVAYDGITVRTKATVSADRRFIRFDLAQELVEFRGLSQLRDDDGGAAGRVVAQTPVLRTTTLRASILTPDGQPVILPLLPNADVAADRVRVILLRPVIHIEEEERELRKDGKT